MRSPRRSIAATSAALLLLVGCQRHDTRATDNAKAPAPTAPAPASKPGDVVDVHGITVKFLDGGAIEVVGKDQWGSPFDTTYESSEFVRKALPVLDRSLTPDQATGLHALLDH